MGIWGPGALENDDAADLPGDVGEDGVGVIGSRLEEFRKLMQDGHFDRVEAPPAGAIGFLVAAGHGHPPDESDDGAATLRKGPEGADMPLGQQIAKGFDDATVRPLIAASPTAYEAPDFEESDPAPGFQAELVVATAKVLAAHDASGGRA